MAYHSSGGYSGDERGGDDISPGDLVDKPTYVMEHLATFTVTKDTGIVYPADGMRRLLQLEKMNGIWSQKMQLCLDRSWVLIIDYESGSVMERFPASLIQEPTAFTSLDPMEMYNNILVFIVGGEDSIPGGSPGSQRSEMHIFQCQSISAQDLVEDLKQLRMGKTVTQHRSNVLPPPNKNSTHAPGRDQQYSHRESDNELAPMNDETSSTSSEKYERDVTVLNHCFDDIEKFIARLQHAAAASRELEKRKRSRRSKKRDPDLGEGLLTMRTKPPPEIEFVDILQKFKLSFNLLAKLKAHIHDPNAPELVHFLFTPLRLIVDASHDTYYDPHLPAKVVTPLLTREAINLLINCVTSKETELWHSLGDAWLIPRDQWKGHSVSYHPVFLDGWSPEYPVIDEVESEGKGSLRSPRDLHIGNEYIDYEQSDGDTNKYMYSKERHSRDLRNNEEDHEVKMTHGTERDIPTALMDFGARSDISVDSIERSGGGGLGGLGVPGGPHDERFQDSWAEELQERGAKVVQVTYPRTANNDKELTVVRGEFLEILDDTRNWWKARNSRGVIAHVPHTIVTPHPFGGDAGDIFNNPLYTQHNYKNNLHRQDSPSDRYSGPSSPSQDGPLGQIPAMQPPASADWVRNRHLDSSSHSEISSDEDGLPVQRSTSAAPPPPPPPPPPVSSPITTTLPPRSRTNTMTTQGGGNLQMQEELKYVLTMFKEKRRNLDIKKTPDIFLQQMSSAEEVQKWLKAKGFSQQICHQLNGVNGNELFELTQKNLVEHCGPLEGKRLAGQITIQRNVSKYKTARTSEFEAFLAKARSKIDRPLIHT